MDVRRMLETLLDHGQTLLAARRFPEAIAAFADAYAMAVTRGHRQPAARALLGRAQAEYESQLTAAAARHADAAFELLTALRMSETKYAADLLTRIDDHRRVT